MNVCHRGTAAPTRTPVAVDHPLPGTQIWSGGSHGASSRITRLRAMSFAAADGFTVKVGRPAT